MYIMLLFDLGGVLVEFDGIAPLIQLSGGRLTPEEARRFWLESPWIKLLEVGRCTPQEFAAGVIADFNLTMTPDEFLTIFRSWEKGHRPGSLELLDALNGRFRLRCLSNNNSVHWQVLCRKSPIARKFERCYVSHEIGLIKPNRDVFEYVLKDVNLPAEAVLFFDDSPECVEAARRVGMHADCVQSIAAIKHALRNRNIVV
jgi:glucose-1-phosphatase